MCTTPLQMLIAQRIILERKNETFDILVYALNDNEKYRYYFDKLQKVCRNSLYLVQENSNNKLLKVASLINIFRSIKKHYSSIDYDNYYLASIDQKPFQYLLSKAKKYNILTFDDGTANIIQNSIYYTLDCPKQPEMIFRKIFGIRLQKQHIRQLSKRHYTIYKDIPNIVDNTVYLPLFNSKSNIFAQNDASTFNFFLGQPLSEISNIHDQTYLETILKKLNIDFYYPHPREQLNSSLNIKIVNSSLIFEEYIIDFLELNPNIVVNVYGFISSSILNLSQVPRINPVFINDKYFREKYSDFYTWASENFNIKIIQL